MKKAVLDGAVKMCLSALKLFSLPPLGGENNACVYFSLLLFPTG